MCAAPLLVGPPNSFTQLAIVDQSRKGFSSQTLTFPRSKRKLTLGTHQTLRWEPESSLVRVAKAPLRFTSTCVHRLWLLHVCFVCVKEGWQGGEKGDFRKSKNVNRILSPWRKKKRWKQTKQGRPFYAHLFTSRILKPRSFWSRAEIKSVSRCVCARAIQKSWVVRQSQN